MEIIIAGIDEAGRGPLAGPVIAAAVILDPNKKIRGLKDSKLLTPKKRDYLYNKIYERAIAIAVGRADVQEIDAINILQATLLAMKRAIDALSIKPHLALIDGNQKPFLPCAANTIIKGDQLEPVISAASIIAKVFRDREMCQLDKQFPGYGFSAHKGYGTPKHLAMLKKLGPCSIHRRSYQPVHLLLTEMK